MVRNYVDLFPSGGITYQVNPKNTLQLTYSRRIDRPSYQDLNPFEFQLDELTFGKGNAFLNPQYTHNIQLSHTFNYTLNTSFSYSRTNDFFTRITDTVNTSASFITFVNLANQQTWNLTVSYPFSPTEWWSIYSNVSAYRVKNVADYGDGKTINVDANVFSLFSQHTFSLPKDFSIELSGFYSSPGIWGGNFETDNFWSIDAGIQKKLWDDRGTLRVGISDIFNSMKWHGVSQFGGQYMDASGGHDSRQLKVNFSYLFGNNQVKSARKRKTGLEEEQKRIKKQ